jgi:TetR/AcrR family transcriptional repressor of bet genes
MRAKRRAQLTVAFARVLANHGYAGATLAAVAAEAGVAPGLLHHHFRDKADLLESLLEDLVTRFRERTRSKEGADDPLAAYLSAAVELDRTSDAVAARCWVGVLAEAVRQPAFGARLRRLLDGELEAIQRRAGGRLQSQEAAALLAFVLGSLVLGAFAPRRTAGFAAPAGRRIIAALTRPGR